ncbi:hypothetical protein ABD76_09400 [Paenibacillus dendritiformis]|uniref:radical SAM protein n=1 Tax=Paenibacillus dendritiformis TaxID=130049 RepID=UPI0018CECA84|nr:radical SAM protein [Paenibacillus dendritiformis]MBG9792696.1 hypothetical protein [Paenibacillus dendritiformis]
MKSKFQGFYDIPLLAKWKAIFIVYGVDFSERSLFNNIPNLSNFKTKYCITQPVAIKKRVFDISEDKSLIPSEVIISHDKEVSLVKLRYNPDSPIQLIYDDGIFLLREKETGFEPPIQIRLVEKLKYMDNTISIRDHSYKMSDFIEIVGMDRISILTFDGCWNWNTHKPCTFCDLHPKREQWQSARPTLNHLPDFMGDAEKWWDSSREVYIEGIKKTLQFILEHEKITPHKHLVFMAGNMKHDKHVWDFTSDIIFNINAIIPIRKFDTYVNISPHHNVSQLVQIQEAGVKWVQYNMEVAGEEAYTKICPGKMKYSLLIEKYMEAVSVFGFGNIRSNFVLGLQPVESLIEGVRNLAELGVVPDYSIFQPKRGTKAQYLPIPSLQEIFTFNERLLEIYQRHHFTPIYCNMSSRSSIVNESMSA